MKKKGYAIVASIAVAVVVGGVASYVAYRHHEDSLLTSYVALGEADFRAGDLSGAQVEYKHALRHGNSATLQADMQLLSQTESAVTATWADLSKLDNQVNIFDTDINLVITPWNSLSSSGTMDLSGNITYNIKGDAPAFYAAYAPVGKDVSYINSEIANINTDSQLLSQGAIAPVVQNLEKASASFENTMNDLDSILSNVESDITSAQRHQYVNFNSQTPEWNADMKKIDAEQTTIVNDVAKFKAYVAVQ